MKLQLCGFELCKLAKQHGFGWDTTYALSDNHANEVHHAWDLKGERHFTIEEVLKADAENNYDNYLVPSLDLLSKWFREVHEINFNYDIFVDGTVEYIIVSDMFDDEGDINDIRENSYEAAQEQALLYAFTLI